LQRDVEVLFLNLNPQPCGMTFMVSNAIVALHALALVANSGPVPIFDGRLTLKPTAVSPADVALLRREALPAARKAAKDKECSEHLDPVDVGTGAFTRPGASQRVVLYRYCVTGDGLGQGGVAVIENDHLVAHFAIDSTSEHSIGVLPDLDGDGLSEIVLAAGGTNMGETWEMAEILAWSPAGPRKLGLLAVYHDDCGNEGKGRNANLLYTTTGPRPSFVQQTFTSACEGKGWEKSGAQTPVVPKADPHLYRLLAPSRP
jgi:hypothetical protein